MLTIQGLGFLCYLALVGYTSLRALCAVLPLRKWARLRPSPSQSLAGAVEQVGWAARGRAVAGTAMGASWREGFLCSCLCRLRAQGRGLVFCWL